MNKYSRYVSVVTASILMLLTTGCWSSNEIEDVSVYVGLGLDAANESRFEREINKQGATYPKRKVLTATVQMYPRLRERVRNKADPARHCQARLI